MTYNFDPDRWYADEQAMLEHLVQQGRLTREQFERQAEALNKKYEDMVKRLDGTYQLPE
ncbi:MAG: hypothetical protein [Olavius algarvensis Delta 4 endosymbiont]|nr:MAG: hypothetical protein [Olavius algarvensis Delta 4 endosymbiont]